MHASTSTQSTLLTSTGLTGALTDNPNSEWPLNSRYYDPLTMRSSVLRDYNSRFTYSPGLLYYVQYSGDEITHGDVRTETVDSRQAFKLQVEQEDSRVVILFFEHLFDCPYDAFERPQQNAFTISVDPRMWLWLLEEFEIHPLFVEFLQDMLGRFSSSTTYGDDGQTPKVFHLMIKVPPAGHLEGAIYLQYDFSTECVLLVVAGNDLKSHIENMIEQLSETKGQIHPLSLILEITSRYFRFLNLRRREIFHAVTKMERTTGRGAISQSDGIPEETNPENFDLTNMHWTGANTRNITFAMNYQLRLYTFLQSELLEFASLQANRSVALASLPKRDKLLYEALKGQIAAVNGALEECRIISERAQWQLMAADTIISTWIAKQSQRTANESKTIAAETRKDSTSMKTIAGLTMVYLPSTFMATVFGMGFFDFDNNGTLSVQPDIWKFVLISIVLTLITVLCWIWLNSHGMPMWMRDLGPRLRQLPSNTRKIKRSAVVQQQASPEPEIAMDSFLSKTIV